LRDTPGLAVAATLGDCGLNDVEPSSTLLVNQS